MSTGLSHGITHGTTIDFLHWTCSGFYQAKRWSYHQLDWRWGILDSCELLGPSSREKYSLAWRGNLTWLLCLPCFRHITVSLDNGLSTSTSVWIIIKAHLICRNWICEDHHHWISSTALSAFVDRSDDLLYPSRWGQLLGLPESRSPIIVEIVSWNDHGESHAIGPILGAQPGSEAWTNDMPHEAFREMTKYFIGRWRDNQKEVNGRELRVWMWYRTHAAGAQVTGDVIGRPGNANWVRKLSFYS